MIELQTSPCATLSPNRRHKLWTKVRKGELSVIKAINSSTVGMMGGLTQTVFTVTGPMVNIPLFASVSMIIKSQNDAVDKLIALVDKLLDEIP